MATQDGDITGKIHYYFCLIALITENTATQVTMTIGGVTNSPQGYESRG
jgi:hypothetical protein